MRPILTVPWAWPAAGNRLAASRPMPANKIRFIVSSRCRADVATVPLRRPPKAPRVLTRRPWARPASVRHARLRRVFDVRDTVKLDVFQLAADLLDVTDIDGLDDVAGFRIDPN